MELKEDDLKYGHPFSIPKYAGEAASDRFSVFLYE